MELGYFTEKHSLVRVVSFIIISFNRPEATINSTENVLNQIVPEGYELELIVINNGSTDSYVAYVDFLRSLSDEQKGKVKYIHNSENLGVAGGRNLGVDSAGGEWLVFIDDDAVFNQLNVIDIISKKYEKYAEENVKILAFLEKRIAEGKDYPSTKSARLAERGEFLTNFFIGCGHCIHKDVFEKVGAYDSSFFYGVEEYDLCYKALDAGFRILYTNEVSVNHFVDSAGRVTDKEKASRMFVNKMLVAKKYLPWRYVFSHFLGWSTFYLKKTNFNLPGYFKSVRKYVAAKRQQQSTPISKETIAHIKSVEGRLTY